MPTPTDRLAVTFKQGFIPDQVTLLGITPIPGDLWSDTSTVPPILKICTSVNPIVFQAVSSGSGASVNDPFVTWASASDLTNNQITGPFLNSVLTTSLPFARGGTLLNPTSAISVAVWRAPFPCTVTAVKGYTADATGTVINALHGVLSLLASNLTISSTGVWMDGGAVQNTAFAAGDALYIQIVSVGGSPSQIGIQVEFTRP